MIIVLLPDHGFEYEPLAIRDAQLVLICADVTRMAMGLFCKQEYAGSNPVVGFGEASIVR